ncbi:alpha-2-HS-glycoprotein 2 [Salarias fasciatus]|uniref:alpha-2-HS-glycoprotein 2 n=1 Tax=Salarias fasciatus TaxID=181472 RepID=UPI001176FFF2|nr:alpha-2-HS-glycoprotein-like [Salarias fasciatus]
MNFLRTVVALGILVAVQARVNVRRPLCESAEAEEAAVAAQDFLNAQHTHGYKYVLNRIEDIKVYSMPEGESYVLEIDLLETYCHVLDPTPLANCTARPKHLTAVEGDCDVVLKRVGGILTVTAFKCKTEVSKEDICLGCPSLLPLNDTAAVDFVETSLGTFNNITANETFVLLEVGRLSSQLLSGGHFYTVEYIVVEANCTDDPCTPSNDVTAARGLCIAKGSNARHSVDCKMFATLTPAADANSTADAVSPPAVHAHTGSLSRKQGLKHHSLTSRHDPELTGLLSAESAESAEIVPVAPASPPQILHEVPSSVCCLREKWLLRLNL